MEYRYKERIPEPLFKLRRLGASIDIAFMAYKSVFWRLTSTTAPLSADKVLGGAYNRQEALHASLAQKRERLERLKRQYDEANLIVGRALDAMEDERYINILTNRYISGMKPHESARLLHYSDNWERELHRKALEEFKRLTEERDATN